MIMRNVSTRMGREDVKEMFGEYRSMCYAEVHTSWDYIGYVDFEDAAEMERARKSIDGREMFGRRISIKRAANGGQRAHGGRSEEGLGERRFMIYRD